MTRGTYNHEITREIVKLARISRNKTQEQFGEICGVHQTTIAHLESGYMDVTVNLQSKLKDGFRRMRVSNEEIEIFKRAVDIKRARNYKV
ncbi:MULTISPECIES: helix-turn-helix transcriptional regulator [Bacillus cereus group]|uniref:Helix-turn-helix transcriptional regulator n=1 Tax=Bacillus mycoides TaxID=1405 RepID=A0ABX6Z8P4_BACMY|nr:MULTISPECIES: helix-turn-helix transcriptional regulator [Bacillus cereus group]AJH18837.1 helix-turn-helix family protein [Bacillus mycoides]MDR4240287.1 helix-turn-helix transcriptional regulator [Bacillus mycoides]MED1426501.1 helix-turn-helix transcriptional regulator [Bacillus mycoides]MED1487530.1 helix-turn-helix transcriptional regulator [Bacillus mycoides]PHE41182.1 XRE family transcriptional regulator [Bacillus pseudomycoides]